MDILSTYKQLKEREANLDILSDVSDLKIYCEEADNKEYYFLSLNLIIEIFINEGLLDDALKTATSSLEFFEEYKDQFNDAYKSFLSFLAYIYITNQNYQRALEIEQKKKDILNSEDKDEVNRWLLECSYIHEAIGEKNEALRKLQAILMNDPTSETKSVALSNLIKLYIDLNEFNAAKESLHQCLELVNAINDYQGIRYCKYLSGKLAHLEKRYLDSYTQLNSLLKDLKCFDSENFNYFNEFLSLLCDMERYREGLDIANKYHHLINESQDLENRLVFYKLYLRLNLLNNKKKKDFFDYTQILDQINGLETEMSKQKNIKTSKLREDELLVESENSAKNITKKLIEGIESLQFNNKESIREYLLKYSSSLINKIPMDEIHYYIFDKSVSNVLPVFPTNNDCITTYQYRNNRLYERKIGYSNTEKTVIEKIIEEPKMFSCDLSKPTNSYIDIIINKEYIYSFLVATPLHNDDGIYGCVVYLSKSSYILSNFTTAFLKASSLIFESHFINLLFKENNKLENKLFTTATNNLNYGLFFYVASNMRMILSDNLKKCLGLSSDIDVKMYNDLVIDSDLNDYSIKYQMIELRKSYDVTYHLKINDEVILFHEQASPLVINGNLYYVGTIDKVSIEEAVKEINRDKMQTVLELKEKIEKLKDKSFVALAVKTNISYMPINYKDEYLYQLFLELKHKYSCLIYLVNDVFIMLFENKTVKEVRKNIGKALFKKYSCKYTILSYPKEVVRADDLIGFSKYLLNLGSLDNDLEIEFTNELYAKYISICTINNCVNKVIIDNNIDLLAQHVTLDNQLVGYYITPNVMGVYNDPNVLSVIDKELRYRLDEHIINTLIKKDFISIYTITLDSLINICNNVDLNNAKIIFEVKGINDADIYLINQIIVKLSFTKCRIIISNELFKVVSLDNLIKNGNVILGFYEEIAKEYLESFKKYLTPYYFNILNGLMISKVVKKLSELNL